MHFEAHDYRIEISLGDTGFPSFVSTALQNKRSKLHLE